MHEVLTVQVGAFANHVGAHFWNLQDQDRAEKTSRGGSTLFREGQAENDTPTVLPRLLVFDHAENFGALRPGGYIYNQKAYDIEAARKVVPWGGQLEVYEAERTETANELLGQGGVQASQYGYQAPASSWPEVVRTHYHPRSTVPLKVEEEGVVEWVEADHGDRLRMFLEECDAPQGLHLLADLSCPLLPLTSGCAREWHQEVGGAGIGVFAFATSASSGTQASGLLDAIASAIAIRDLLQADALVLPLATQLAHPYRRLDGEEVELTMQGHVAPLMACAIDMATAPYRHPTPLDERVVMREWMSGLRGGGCSLGSLELSHPLSPDMALSQLDTLLQPSDPRSVLRSPKPQGLLAQLVPLWAPGSQPPPPDTPLRRLSAMVSLRGLSRHRPSQVVNSINDAIKYYPWNLPHLTHARSDPLPTQRPPFPSDILGPGATTAAFYTAAGCTDGVVPYLQSLTDALSRRSPRIKAHLRERQGLLDEDLAEVEDVITSLIEGFE